MIGGLLLAVALAADPVTPGTVIREEFAHATPATRRAWCAAYDTNRRWWLATYPAPARAAVRAALGEVCS